MIFKIKGMLKEYEDLTAQDIDYIVMKYHVYGVQYVCDHSLFNQQHVDCVVKGIPWLAVIHLKHRLSDENLEYLAVNYPNNYEELFTE
jgi:hypothetical protein